MASLQDLLRRRPRVDEAELEDVRERTVARLHAYIDSGNGATPEGPQVIELVAPLPSTDRPMVPIIVEGEIRPDVEPAAIVESLETVADADAVQDVAGAPMTADPDGHAAPTPGSAVVLEPDHVPDPIPVMAAPSPGIAIDVVWASDPVHDWASDPVLDWASEPVHDWAEGPTEAPSVPAEAADAEAPAEPLEAGADAELDSPVDAVPDVAPPTVGAPKRTRKPRIRAGKAVPMGRAEAASAPDVETVVEPLAEAEAALVLPKRAPKAHARKVAAPKRAPKAHARKVAATTAPLEAPTAQVADAMVEPPIVLEVVAVEPEPIVEPGLDLVIAPIVETIADTVVELSVEPEPIVETIVDTVVELSVEPEPIVEIMPTVEPVGTMSEEPLADAVPTAAESRQATKTRKRAIPRGRVAPRQRPIPTPPARPTERSSPAATNVTTAFPATASCPYCASLLDPAPSANSRCPRCRSRIVVKRVQGRVVYLTEAAVAVFEAERVRATHFGRWSKERARWLKLAASVDAPAARIERLDKSPMSAESVGSARNLYISTVDQSARQARRDGRWEDASRMKRELAQTMFRLAGAPVPPSDDVVEFHREAVASELRGIGLIVKEAELVAAPCCDTCRADDGVVVRIAAELREPRLPHAGCPKGLCRCHWEIAVRDESMVRRYLQRKSRVAKTRRTED